MKFDAITIGALGFAAFAAWAYLGRNKGATVSGGAGQVYNMLGNQRAQVGEAKKQNTAGLPGLAEWMTWQSDKSRYGLSNGGSPYGFKQ